jgi:hypothetical protein
MFSDNLKFIFVKILSKIIPNPTTFILYSGEDWYYYALKMKGNKTNIKLIPIHSYDYSNTLIYINSINNDNKVENICFLDCPTPMFTSDYELLKHKIYNTVEKWYPSLCNFFSIIEQKFKTNICIAGHYKTMHSPNPDYFEKRSVIYNKTIDIVKNSKIVITQFSTAISYAVIFRKPIIFIFSNELLEDKLSISDTYFFAEHLGAKVLNIDDFNENEIDLSINDERYIQYEKKCLTSNNTNSPNYEIILKVIIESSSS